MSYALVIAPDAKSQLLELDFDLQERVLDVLDEVAADPPPTSHRVSHIRDFLRSGPNADDLVFVRMLVDRPRREIVLTGAILVPRPH